VRHLVVCCDGTWQTTVNDSNVVRLRDALAGQTRRGRPQLHRYVAGVGTAGTVAARLVGAATGFGLSANVRTAYRLLAETYQPGDLVALFGFSRGAYTARSLAGMVASCGLLDPTGLDSTRNDDADGQVQRVYQHYRTRDQPSTDPGWADGLSFHVDADATELPIRFIGVWDTVGSLGIPDGLRWWGQFDPADYQFHDVQLDPRIRHARHAIALDEQRGPFSPTRWAAPAPGQDIQEVWFPGEHLDVGGGLVRGLSDGALRWMMDEAQTTIGLEFDPAIRDRYRPDPLAIRHPVLRAVDWIEHGLADVVLLPRPRPIPRIDPAARRGDVHESAYVRQAAPDLPGGRYRPTTTLTDGASATVRVPADTGWVATGLWLEPGGYSFTTAGTWGTPLTTAGADGVSRLLSVGRLVGSVVDRAAGLFRRLVENPMAAVAGARREPDLPWLSLVGYVANEERDGKGRIITGPERIPIGTGTTHRVERPGYLYAFANAAWGSYATHRGAIELSVRRTGAATAARTDEPDHAPGTPDPVR
jgi:hypothetical protein